MNEATQALAIQDEARRIARTCEEAQQALDHALVKIGSLRASGDCAGLQIINADVNHARNHAARAAAGLKAFGGVM